ncbi:hypothetical protein DC522_19040 [Microvirga sp. KLBC 81]|uniref:hypothetical protein n=1 Tax=Microvirga sp. KLBC 81 TaxID=1862707 RepID=UPI000D52563E|nr:hypothetical protein [Microvirga sp. KLBC 81]PVE22837.1 hypothetical protein DC522_19040 [Microvirga sp. KLBC 81]
MDNPLIGLLRTYGPSAASSSLFDEHVRDEVRKHKVKEFEIPAPNVKIIADILKQDAAPSVILTGTAGDGKTYHIRKVFLDELGGPQDQWPGDVIKSIKLPNGRELRIIRDLTEVPKDRKKAEINDITRCLLGEEPNVSYLVAANDGQLLMLWREAFEDGGADAPRHEAVHDILATMMRQEDRQDKGGRLKLELINLSRETRVEMIDEVIDAMLGHEHWEAGCSRCPLATSQYNPCPILLNRALLKGDPNVKESERFRQRLKEAIDLASANDKHVPIRQLFAFVSNIILGSRHNPDHPLLDCKEARQVARDKAYRRTNPYNNALGLNLREERRRNNAIFSIMETFGLGHETNNAIDNLLLNGEPKSVIERLGKEDRFYGDEIFSEQRNRYMRGSHDALDRKSFSEAMETQRRRLFFRMPQDSISGVKPGPLDPWALTIFQHAGLYLAFRDAMEHGNNKALIDNVMKALIKGLNRTLTGMMTEDGDQLWLAGSIGKTDDPTGRIALQAPISRLPGGGFFRMKVEHSGAKRRPYLTIGLSTQFAISLPMKPPQLDLRLIIFEYLMRVAAGSLPSSFSRQCHQEVRRFAVMLSKELSKLNGANDSQIGILSINEQGTIQSRNIEVAQ